MKKYKFATSAGKPKTVQNYLLCLRDVLATYEFNDTPAIIWSVHQCFPSCHQKS